MITLKRVIIRSFLDVNMLNSLLKAEKGRFFRKIRTINWILRKNMIALEKINETGCVRNAAARAISIQRYLPLMVMSNKTKKINWYARTLANKPLFKKIQPISTDW